MNSTQKNPIFITPEMIEGPMMVPGKLTEENRLAIVAIIEKNKAEKKINLQSSTLKHKSSTLKHK